MQAGEPSARDRRYKNKGLASSLRAGCYIPVRIGNSATHMHTQPGAPLGCSRGALIVRGLHCCRRQLLAATPRRGAHSVK